MRLDTILQPIINKQLSKDIVTEGIWDAIKVGAAAMRGVGAQAGRELKGLGQNIKQQAGQAMQAQQMETLKRQYQQEVQVFNQIKQEMVDLTRQLLDLGVSRDVIKSVIQRAGVFNIKEHTEIFEGIVDMARIGLAGLKGAGQAVGQAVGRMRDEATIKAQEQKAENVMRALWDSSNKIKEQLNKLNTLRTQMGMPIIGPKSATPQQPAARKPMVSPEELAKAKQSMSRIPADRLQAARQRDQEYQAMWQAAQRVA